MSIAFQYAASLTGASVDERKAPINLILEFVLTESSEAHHLFSPVLPARRSPEAYTGCQTLSEEFVHYSVHQHDRSLAVTSLTQA